MSTEEHHCDVAVIGGGPAGSTAATLLAEKGWQVAQFEKASHPRFHIGESLLPMNLPILERLGVLDRVAELGVYKPGGEFYDSAYGDQGSKFDFGEQIDKTWPHAYQIKREDFDKVLFDNAGSRGVMIHDQTRVLGVDWDAPDRARLTVNGADGETREWTARFVVDASGRDTLLGRKFGIKAKNPRHASAALFGHFNGVERHPGEDAGLVSVYWFEHGWFWVIPLRDDITSVGAVCDPGYLKQRRNSPEEFLQQTIELAPESLRRRMAGAERIGSIQATGNFSYGCSRMYGPGYVLVGDAFAFVDPVFSSGVYLGMSSAERAVDYVDAELRGASNAAALRKRFVTGTRHGIKTFSWMINRFNSPSMKRMLMAPGNPLRVRDAIVSLLCGDFHRRNGVMWRFQLFKFFYYFVAAKHLGETFAEYKRRRARVKAGFQGDTIQTDAG